ncbi:nicotinate (nicotinamide) nucleotide adenylyltransferase [bacterium]|nr:nicotinate (nicotinamide) nucleotide adenylyltransferase [bacterium]MCI0605645.1 nicotinate (nicotinamide) nucleotide adenylyltransferase [bacterium]
MNGRRIGLMGGTFDPPHLAHTFSVEVAASEFHLDSVWFVPAFIPPHKQDQNRTNPFHRMAMLALALRDFPVFKILPLELLRGDISFTVDTIHELKSRVANEDRLFFIMGSDSFLEIHTWYAPAELLRSCELIIINRGSIRSELIENLEQLEISLQLDLKDSIHFSSSPYLPFSSTEIRERIREGKSASAMLSSGVEAYIHKHSLYRR